MEHIENNIEGCFVVKNNKPKLWDEPFKFAYKLTFVVLIGFFITYGLVNGLISSYISLKKLNNYISENNVTDINFLIEKIQNDGENLINQGWIRKIKDGENNKYVINSLFSFIKKENNLKAIFAPGEYLIYYFSYFTILSNILTIVWMAYALFKPSHEGNKGLLNMYGATIIATYITITSIIFNTTLMPVIIIATGTFLGNKPMPIIEQEFVHTIGPIAFVVYICNFVKYKDVEKENNKNMYKTWGYGVIGLISYGIYTIIRGLLKYFGGYDNNDFYSWPYFFTQVLEKESIFFKLPGWSVFIIFILIIATIFIGFNTLYWKIITIWKNKKNIQQKL